MYALNELRADVAPEEIWAWLVRAPLWPRLYSNAKRVRIVEGQSPDVLLDGTRFSWITFGLPITSTVEVFEPPHRLGWRVDEFGAHAYHVWHLHRDGAGTYAVTEETQAGSIPSLMRWPMRLGLRHFHQRWLEGLARRAAEGPPPAA